MLELEESQTLMIISNLFSKFILEAIMSRKHYKPNKIKKMNCKCYMNSYHQSNTHIISSADTAIKMPPIPVSLGARTRQQSLMLHVSKMQKWFNSIFYLLVSIRNLKKWFLLLIYSKSLFCYKRNEKQKARIILGKELISYYSIITL